MVILDFSFLIIFKSYSSLALIFGLKSLQTVTVIWCGLNNVIIMTLNIKNAGEMIMQKKEDISEREDRDSFQSNIFHFNLVLLRPMDVDCISLTKGSYTNGRAVKKLPGHSSVLKLY